MLLCGQLVRTSAASGDVNSESEHRGNATLDHQRRLYGLVRIEGPPPPGFGTWLSPWPWNEQCKKYRIQYCFEDELALKALHEMFRKAIGRWSKALDDDVSDLEIVPDAFCKDSECVCKKDVTAPETVVVKKAMPHDRTFVSLGDLYGIDTPGRHYIQINPMVFDPPMEE